MTIPKRSVRLSDSIRHRVWEAPDSLTDAAPSSPVSGEEGRGDEGIKGEVRYKAWGETRFTSGNTPTTFRYTGQREQPELGLYFYNARWYDPALGRFIQADSIVPQPGNSQAWDRYTYALNNPLRYVDPSGHDADCMKRDSACKKQVQNEYKKELYRKILDNTPWDQFSNREHNLLLSLGFTQGSYSFYKSALPKNPSNTEPQSDVDGEWIAELYYYLLFTSGSSDFIDLMITATNYGKPVVKQIAYILPFGTIEAFSLGLIQIIQDLQNQNLSPGQIIFRGAGIGGEAFITDIVSRIGGGMGGFIGTGAGSTIGPEGAAVVGPVGYFAGAYITSRAVDNYLINTINPTFFPIIGFGSYP